MHQFLLSDRSKSKVHFQKYQTRGVAGILESQEVTKLL